MDGRKSEILRKIAVAALLPTALIGASGCTGADDDLPSLVDEETTMSDEAPEEGADSPGEFENYTGVYDSQFFDDVEFYVGQEVTLAGIVGEVISPNMFTLVSNTAPPEDDVVDVDAVIVEPLLVVHREDLSGLAAGMPVGVVGEVHEEFYAATVEQELQVDLGNDGFEDWDEQAYLEANSAASLITE